MKTELMMILELRRLEKEAKRLAGIYKTLTGQKDAEGNPSMNPADALAIQTAMAINNHLTKQLNWVLDNEPIKTTL